MSLFSFATVMMFLYHVTSSPIKHHSQLLSRNELKDISTLWQMFNPANHLLRTMLYGKEKKTIYKKMDCKRENVSRTQVCKLKICTLVIRSLHSRKIPRFL